MSASRRRSIGYSFCKGFSPLFIAPHLAGNHYHLIMIAVNLRIEKNSAENLRYFCVIQFSIKIKFAKFFTSHTTI